MQYQYYINFSYKLENTIILISIRKNYYFKFCYYLLLCNITFYKYSLLISGKDVLLCKIQFTITIKIYAHNIIQ